MRLMIRCREKRPGVEHTYDVVVADFGTSRTFSRETKFMTQNVGTGRYQAPEVIEGNQYNSAADIFSFGKILTRNAFVN